MKKLKIYFLILLIISLIISYYIFFEIVESKNSIMEFPNNFEMLLVEKTKENFL